MCVNISSIKRIFSNQSHYFPDIPCIGVLTCVRAAVGVVSGLISEELAHSKLLTFYEISNTGSLFYLTDAVFHFLSLTYSINHRSSVAPQESRNNGGK